MRVVETLGVYDGYPVHMLYRREATCVRIRPLGREQSEFSVSTDRWSDLLAAIEAGDRTTFGVSVAASVQAPYRALYDEIEQTVRTTDEGRPLGDTELSCIAAVLYHEGVLIHYSGALGRSEPARMVLRRSKTS